MLNAVKHLYHAAARIRGGTAAMHRQARRSFLWALAPVLKYAVLLLGLSLAAAGKIWRYPVETLEGKKAVITASNNTDKSPVHLTISCPTDTLILPVYYWTDGEAGVTGRNFLQVRYHIRAGSDLSAGNLLVLCISHGKLYQSMRIESYFSETSYFPTHNYYSHPARTIVAKRLTVDSKKVAHITVIKSAFYKKGFGTDKHSIQKYTAHLSTEQPVFFSCKKKADAVLIKYNGNTDLAERQHFTGTAPVLQLDGVEYIFVNQNWYAKRKEYYHLMY